MQPTPNRRVNRSESFPTRMFVELGEGDARESFEADVVDFTRSGASMRASYMPEIGTQLDCRFRCGPSGALVSARSEVTWAQLEGESTGEFGLAFLELDPEAEWLIEEMLAEPILKREREREPEADAITRLELEGSTEPIEARLARLQAGSAVFEQQLDLLSLGRGVRAHAPGSRDRSGSIVGVELRMVGNVPMLAVTVSFDEESELAPSAAPAADLDLDLNLPHDTVADMSAPQLVASAEPGAKPSSTLTEFSVSERVSRPRRMARAASDDSRQEPLEFVLDDVADDLDPDVTDPSTALAQGQERGAFQERVAALAAPLRDGLQGLRAALDARLSSLRASALQLQERSSGELRELYNKEFGTRLGALRRLLARRRRTAATAAGAGNRRDPSGLAPSHIALLAAGGLAACAVLYAVFGHGPEHHLTPVVATAPAQALSEGESDLSASNVGVPAAQPEPGQAPTPTPAPRAPIAGRPRNLSAGVADDMGGAAQEGPATTSATAAAVASEARPQSAIRSSKTRFGASDLPHANRFPIRMSAPVSALEGNAASDGFTVTVAGAQALDPAAPLVARFPELISKAKIRNRNGVAQLEVHFVNAKRPLYQVSAEGSTLYIALRDK